MEQLTKDKEEIQVLAAKQDQQREDQKAQVAAIKAVQASLNQQYAQETALRAQLHATELTLQEQVAAAKRALEQVNAEIAQLEQARRRAHSSGYFAWPGLQGPITQSFGCTDFRGEPPPPSGYSCPARRPYFHAGIDIGAPYGSEVTSADGGIAYTYSGNYGYGNHVIVVHANGFTTLYGHLAGFAVVSGSPVAKGQRLGYEGSTGFSTGAHLHFEVRLRDSPQDPCRYVGC
jgi:murein DD-endopeptidase MepM/ murein hydrolase activator NlpD